MTGTGNGAVGPDRPIDLKHARILISNDDGIYAPGIEVLIRVARSLSDDVWVVAPETEQSATGHSLTIRRPLRIREHGANTFAVDGTPTDSVLLAVNELMKDRQPDLVLSGINRGGNLGEDIVYSGTVAAAMEATILGVPAIALSQDFERDEDVPWETAEQWAPGIIQKLAARGWPENTLININFPPVLPGDVAGVRACIQGRRKVGDVIVRGIDPRGVPYYWIGGVRSEDKGVPGTDLAAMADKCVSVTPVSLDLTATGLLGGLETTFA